MATTDDQFVTAEGLASSLSVVGGGPVVPTAWWYGNVSYAAQYLEHLTNVASGYNVSVELGNHSQNIMAISISVQSEGTYLVSLGGSDIKWYSSAEDVGNSAYSVTNMSFLFHGTASTGFKIYMSQKNDFSCEVSVEKVG